MYRKKPERCTGNVNNAFVVVVLFIFPRNRIIFNPLYFFCLYLTNIIQWKYVALVTLLKESQWLKTSWLWRLLSIMTYWNVTFIEIISWNFWVVLFWVVQSVNFFQKVRTAEVFFLVMGSMSILLKQTHTKCLLMCYFSDPRLINILVKFSLKYVK